MVASSGYSEEGSGRLGYPSITVMANLVPTVEEYTPLLCCPKIQVDKAYSRTACVLTFWRKLMNITGMSELWITARIRQKGECKCTPWKILRDLILAHPDTKKGVDFFALSIYGLMIFSRALRYVDELHQGGMTYQRKIGWQYSQISRKKTSNGELLGWFLMKSSTGMEILTGSLCWEFREPSDMLLYLY
ncbi:hypothetical protein J1N35_023091 [Gossypium stocksii]|uniref:Uncharacterized protein n=1 Tax=Gossypium stocksii TaxID=47602 RepID=A0A9D3VH92_9ROSI|nr:hypothetical protein J1N35_023091 [Gossypium stocksii]